MPATQIERPFRIKTSLGDDALLLNSFIGYERISTPFHFTLQLLSEDPNIDMKDLLMKPAVLSIKLDDDSERHIHGIFNRIKLMEYGEDGMAAYEAEMVPWLWFLTIYSNCRIFQNKSVPDIVSQVFTDRGFSDFTLKFQNSYQPREYCVQYRETDFNFVSRLLEEEGIFYFFQQTEDKHTLVLADARSAFEACPHKPKAQYTPSVGGRLDEDTVLSIEEEHRVNTGKTSLTDYDFEKPHTSLDATLSGHDEGQSDEAGEYYDYPGNYKTKSDGDNYVKIRLEEREVGLVTLRGNGNCMGFECGYKFSLSEHFRDSANQDYTLIALQHSGRNTSYRSANPDPFEYNNQFEAIPNAVPFRPPSLARKPFIPSTQTAVVVGKSGEEIWTDKYGRIKVQFFWDREGQADEKSSCWIRVAQGWAGKQWGSIYIPRIGQEVVVSFLEGDPDRPLITGSVYNADQTVPYTLPDEQTKSTLKSMSSKGGGGFNEIRLEDKKGSEQVFIHAEKDLHQRVKDSRFETIIGSTNLIVNKDQLEKIGGDTHLQVTGDQNEKVGGTVSLNAGADLEQKIGSNWAADVGQEIHLKSGMNLVIESGVTLTLKVGGNFININPAGVFISGTMVFINSGGSAGSGADASPEAPKDPTEADTAQPGELTTVSPHKGNPTSQSLGSISPAAAVLMAAAQSGAPFCEH